MRIALQKDSSACSLSLSWLIWWKRKVVNILNNIVPVVVKFHDQSDSLYLSEYPCNRKESAIKPSLVSYWIEEAAEFVRKTFPVPSAWYRWVFYLYLISWAYARTIIFIWLACLRENWWWWLVKSELSCCPLTAVDEIEFDSSSEDGLRFLWRLQLTCSEIHSWMLDLKYVGHCIPSYGRTRPKNLNTFWAYNN